MVLVQDACLLELLDSLLLLCKGSALQQSGSVSPLCPRGQAKRELDMYTHPVNSAHACS